MFSKERFFFRVGLQNVVSLSLRASQVAECRPEHEAGRCIAKKKASHLVLQRTQCQLIISSQAYVEGLSLIE